jgi:hypothetical protein
MATSAKLGNRVGVSEWETLETPADVRRFLRWVTLSMRDGSLKPGEASIFAQLGGVLLKATQATDLEARIRHIEELLERDANKLGSTPTTH